MLEGHALARQAARVATAALLVTAVLAPAAPGTAAATTFAVVNSASYESPAVPRGALVTIYTNGSVSDLPAQSFAPWSTQLPDGLTVEASCDGSAGRTMRLPIKDIAGGGTQLNVYYPNDVGAEPWGTCTPAGESRITVTTGPSHGNVAVSKTLPTVQSHPGVFFEGDNVPAGYHYGLAGFPPTRLVNCGDTPTSCPVSAAGFPARLSLVLTGAEYFVTNPGKLSVELARVVGGVIGSYLPQTLLSITLGAQGTEDVLIALRPGTAPGEYRLRVTNSVHTSSGQQLKIVLGAPA